MTDDFVEQLDSPLGAIEICAGEQGLTSVLFMKTAGNELPERTANPNIHTATAKAQLERYFKKEHGFFNLSLSMRGTDFQNKVWTELCKIPFGKTISYLSLARRLGDEKVIRAAASANGKNPFAIIVPCHRVIGTDGSLTGYAGDLWRKKWLLEHEAPHPQTDLFSQA